MVASGLWGIIVRRASILIRTLNEAKGLPATLDAVFCQSQQPHEVIVIDSGSTDGTVAIARRYPVVVLEIPPKEWSYPRALNIAASRATGEIIVCLSAHSVPRDEEWLARLTCHFDDQMVAAVWGQELNQSRSRPTLGPPVRQTKGHYTAKSRLWGLSNANSALRRSRWLELAFDERLPAAEDKAWGMEMLERGWVIVYEPAAVTLHARHSPLHAYRRNRDIMHGFRFLFPELSHPNAGALRRISLEVRQIADERAETGLLSRPGSLLKHSVTVAAHLIGGFVGSRRSARNSR